MSWFLAFAGFAALIILHEFGHFIAAKATGMRVERFSLFFPPLIVRRQVGARPSTASAPIPLGGYVKITGMNPEEELPPEVAPRAYYHQPVWKRIVVIGAGPAMNLLIAFVHPVRARVRRREGLDARSSRSPTARPRRESLQPGDRILSVDGKSRPAATSRSSCGLPRRDLEPQVRRAAASRAAAPRRRRCFRVERDGRVVTVRVRPRVRRGQRSGR